MEAHERELDRIVEHVQRILPDGGKGSVDTWAEVVHWNVLRLKYLLEELDRAKAANKNILAADIAVFTNEAWQEFMDLVIQSIPDYEYKETVAKRMNEGFGTRLINPDNN